eukprot:Colp12_sorted_trinity150504_noHs@10097
MSCCGGKPCGPASCPTSGPQEAVEDVVRDSVKEYYGKVLQKTEDLKTNACCTGDVMPKHFRSLAAKLHEEVVAKYYGCGLTIPDLLEGTSILDLGSGSGRDCFLASGLVGENGRVVGVDMTDEQISVARKHIDFHTKAFGYKSPNIEFKQGYIERLGDVGLEENYFDIIISNCVINLSPDKDAVLREAFRVLKPGGELYFSDVYSDRRIPKALQEDPVLYGECLSGALYWNDFLNMAKKAGFTDPRLVDDAPITISNKKIEEVVGDIRFFSATYRLFKLPSLESDCEDYGQAVVYKGTIPYCQRSFKLDGHHIFVTGKAHLVCGNTYDMLAKTRFAPHFDFINPTPKTHFGIFPDCGKNMPFSSAPASAPAKAGGCC